VSVTTSIEALAEPIGYDIAQSTDRVQADLLNGLGRGFAQMHTRDAETQMAYLAPLLTPEARGMLTAARVVHAILTYDEPTAAAFVVAAQVSRRSSAALLHGLLTVHHDLLHSIGSTP
jgi:hypothetical protein